MQIDRTAVSVSEFMEYVSLKISSDPFLRDVRVTGEISGYKLHTASGHRYFTLKDEGAAVNCAFFRQNAYSLDFPLADGMRVTVTARAGIFTKTGAFQLYVQSVKKEGEGELYLRFEKLKKRLEAEGLFNPARKREIPFLPKIIGVATSASGAALRDIIRVARRRNPNVGILISPCAVQGKGSEMEIAGAIKRLNDSGECDVILVGRGGGSIEDLWCFNEEVVARAIYSSGVPVISCVGHETDFTIADFVADVRAATPSMAAEIAVPVAAELYSTVETLYTRLSNSLLMSQALRRARLDRLLSSPYIKNPIEAITSRKTEALGNLASRLKNTEKAFLDTKRATLSELRRSLNAVNPASVLSRGYAAVKKGDVYIDRAGKLKKGDNVRIIMSDGSKSAEIND